jgi:hypothetical protein
MAIYDIAGLKVDLKNTSGRRESRRCPTLPIIRMKRKLTSRLTLRPKELKMQWRSTPSLIRVTGNIC